MQEIDVFVSFDYEHPMQEIEMTDEEAREKIRNAFKVFRENQGKEKLVEVDLQIVSDYEV